MQDPQLFMNILITIEGAIHCIKKVHILGNPTITQHATSFPYFLMSLNTECSIDFA